MTHIYTIPNWFFGYDICLEVLFGIIAFFVAFYSLKIYRTTKQREFGLFGTSFILISLSYFIWSIINVFLVQELTESTKVLILNEINLFSVVGIYSHILLFMAGLVTLFYMTCKVEDPKLYSALLLISSLAILFSFDKAMAVYSISSIILVYICVYYLNTFRKNGVGSTLSIFGAFVLLFFANVLMMFTNDSYINYADTHILELASFLIILFTFIRALKYGKKEK
ncbi:Uncharacterised protein [uncultured archaeon]|nr:Uncharacterised protein [uncultured archaeon]